MLRLTFLGTSAAQPTIHRNLTGLAVRRDRELFLVDCGEGTQRQMIRFGTGFDVDAIFFTHFHADHYLGAIGFLRTLSMQGRTTPMDVYGPRPAKRLLDVMLFSGTERLAFEVRIHEVGPGVEIRRDRCRMRAFATEHRTPSVGWALVEDERPGRFTPEKAASLGVPWASYGALQRGEPVTLADGRVVRPEEVVDPHRRGRAVVVTGDTRPCAGTIAAARGADVLVHDCTFGDSEAARGGDDALDRAGGGAGRARGGGPRARAHASLHPLRPRVAAARRRGTRGVGRAAHVGERRNDARGAAPGRSGPRALGGLKRSARAAHRRRRPRPLDPAPRPRLARRARDGVARASPRQARAALRPARRRARLPGRRRRGARAGRAARGRGGGRPAVEGAHARAGARRRAVHGRGPPLGAYLLFYWPVSYLQARGILSELPRRPRTALDLGSGPAPVAFAALDAGAAEVVAADRSARALAAARSLAVAAGEPISTREWNPARSAPLAELAGGHRFDLVTMGHVVNELFPGPDADARRAGLLEQALELVAPVARSSSSSRRSATPRALLRVRDLLVARGYAVRAPCLFRGPCPALLRETDWCHAERPIEPPPIVAQLGKAAGLRKEAVKMSYLVLAPRGEGWAAPPAGRVFRIVSEPLASKGRLRYMGCGPEGR
jgi:ribonuclease Z